MRSPSDQQPLSPDELEAALRATGNRLYHDRHPFHRALHDGRLSRLQVQAWALNRYYYQSRIPVKDAILLSRLPTPALRREWRRRIEDHDGDSPDTGGIARWLELTDALGLDRALVTSTSAILPGTRFAVDAYVDFVGRASVLEAIASSLTELFAPTIIGERVAGMLRHYAFVDRDALSYFSPRLSQAREDSAFALAYVRDHARTCSDQAAVLAALGFKCAVLWSQLDALHHAYLEPALPPPGAFQVDQHAI